MSEEMTDQEFLKAKARWARGPWDDEPDKVQWTTKSGLPGLIVRNHSGSLCGYAAVSKEHPLYGTGYGDVDADIDVHGGLTYSNQCQGNICHVPQPGEPDDVWWFGFDCGHHMDTVPAFVKMYKEMEERSGVPEQFRELTFGKYRNMAYVKLQVEVLAEQLRAIGV